ncbi:MAG TPA: hypothetical protein PK098_09725, partial [Phycisphaerales bacterium]|nr:hypothetical protein [Phycisphaerales bacterium]
RRSGRVRACSVRRTPAETFLMTPEPASYCPADLNGDFRVDVQDLLILLGAWGPCPGVVTTVKSLSEEIDDAGLTQQQWQDYYNIMTGNASQRTKDNWTCWFNNRITQCQNCPVCPGYDPFAND